jgi:hypothetical protein
VFCSVKFKLGSEVVIGDGADAVGAGVEIGRDVVLHGDHARADRRATQVSIAGLLTLPSTADPV